MFHCSCNQHNVQRYLRKNDDCEVVIELMQYYMK